MHTMIHRDSAGRQFDPALVRLLAGPKLSRHATTTLTIPPALELLGAGSGR
jgi:hypothetical protein